VASGRQARVWDCRDATFATPELEHPQPVTTLAFHPRGELLATGSKDHTCRVFAVSTKTGTPLMSFRHVVPGRVKGLTPIPPVFVDEGRGLLTVSDEEGLLTDQRGLSRHDLGTKKDVPVPMFDSFVHAIALSANGKYMLAGEHIYDVESMQPVGLR